MDRRRYHDFSFEPPSDWIDRSTVLWISPPRYEGTKKLPRENFVVERQTRGQTNTDPVPYLQERIDTLQKGLQHFALLREVTSCTYSGCQGAEVSYSLLMEELPVQQRHVVLFSDDSIYHLIATATASRYADVESSFQQILESFQLER